MDARFNIYRRTIALRISVLTDILAQAMQDRGAGALFAGAAAAVSLVSETLAKGKQARGERPDGEYRFGDFCRGLFKKNSD